MQRETVVYAALAGGTGLWLGYIWLFSGAAWLHPELLGSSYYIWIFPETDILSVQLRRMFDWKAFDPNVNRVRPLNDVFETIDAIARPYLTQAFGPQPALLPSAMLTLITVPPLLFGWLRRVLGAWRMALLLVLIFVATPAFLSVTVASLHPAKRICMILFCAALYFAQLHQDNGKRLAGIVAFVGLALSLLLGFFADEMGLAAWPVIGILYWRSLMANRFKLALYLLLPVAFIALTKWWLPAFYLRKSVHGAWDALSDGKKLAVFRYLLVPDFYIAALRQTARSILSVLGIGFHNVVTETVAALAVCGLTGWRREAWPALVTLFAASVYATLLDWYPFPNEISYMGSFNYYYHSAIGVLVIVWLAYVMRSMSFEDVRIAETRIGRLAGASLAALIVTANFYVFDRVNTLATIIHMYPFSNAEIFRALGQPASVVHVTATPDAERRELEAILRELFGEQWQENGFYKAHKMLVPTPTMGETQIKLLFRAYHPHVKVTDVQVQ